jgi:hypothetical protein
MVTTLALLTTLVTATSAWAGSLDRFSCTTLEKLKDGQIHHVNFDLKDLDLAADGATDAVKFAQIDATPSTSPLGHLGAASSLALRPGRLEIDADAKTTEGNSHLLLVLYQEGRFQTGFVRIKGTTGTEDQYSPVSCRHVSRFAAGRVIRSLQV